jgi:hypothetical protein
VLGDLQPRCKHAAARCESEASGKSRECIEPLGEARRRLPIPEGKPFDRAIQIL